MGETKFTPGPWGWSASRQRIYLATLGRGSVFVMGFARMGMQGAQPTFQVHKDGCDQRCRGCGRMTDAIEIAKPLDHNGYGRLDHPDAHLIATAPELYEALYLLQEAVEWEWRGDNPEMIARMKLAETALAKARGEGA